MFDPHVGKFSLRKTFISADSQNSATTNKFPIIVNHEHKVFYDDKCKKIPSSYEF